MVQRPRSSKYVFLSLANAAIGRYSGANPAFRYKQAVYKYLQELNTPKQQLEYTLFRPGWFSNYLTYPQSSCRYFHQTCVWINVSTCQALVIRGLDPWICLTSVQDTATVVAQAVEDTRTWPTRGGIVGMRLKQRDIIRRAEMARGGLLQIVDDLPIWRRVGCRS